jgi:ketosteroid isomerase-like protein
MNKAQFASVLLLFTLLQLVGQSKTNKYKQILDLEQSFQDDLNQKGVAYAFEKYAADNAVINRGKDSLIYGKSGIRNFYANEMYSHAKATWQPVKIEFSSDSSMASSYGNYEWHIKDNGKVFNFRGVFHTVWKQQKDGTWLYIWD